MTKLLKYLKPFILPILLVIGLLYGQAQADLALPDYMSKIITDGIQYSGITDTVFNEVSLDTLDHVLLFVDEDKKDFVKNSYECQDTCTLTTLTKVEREDLSLVLQDPIVMVYFLSNENVLSQANMGDNSFSFMEQLPANMSIFDALKMLPSENLQQIKEQASFALATQNNTSISGYAKLFIKSEYEALGYDIEALQMKTLLSTGLSMLGLALAVALLSIAVSFLSSRIGAGFARDVRKEVFTKIESFSNVEFNKFSTASLITRTTNDVQQVQVVIIMVLRMLVYAPIIGVGALIKVLDTNSAMTFIIFAVIVVILLIIAITMKIAMPKFKIVQQLVDRLNLVMRETLSGMLVIRAFHNEKHQQERFEKANQDITSVNLFTSRVMSILMPLMTFIMSSVSVVIIWVGSKQIDLGTLEVGSMMAFLQYSMQIIMSFLMISMMSIMLPRSLVSAGRIAEVLTTDTSICDKEQPQQFPKDVKGVVEFKNVCFRYPGAEEDVLHNISFTAHPNQITAFIGSTGSGKSTLINLLPRFFDVTSGAILVDGVDIRDVSQKDLRDKIGYVPQKGLLISGTIESNLKYAKEDATKEDLDLAARISQAEEFISSKPEGYGSAIAQGGSNVSGGQRQRLSIARALIKKPEIFIFDDSFSALDFKTDAALRKSLNELIKETHSTTFIVAQRISSIMHADQICVLDNGKIVGIGTHEELMNSCSVYQEIALSQLSKEELAHE